MPPEISTDNCIRIADGDSSVLPCAEEIYSVVFEGGKAIRGIEVAKEDFTAAGLEYSKFAADPLIVLGMIDGNLSCGLMARQGNTEYNVAHDGCRYLDYALGGGKWIPLPIGAVDEALKVLAAAEVGNFGSITLKQYMRLTHQKETDMLVVDKTGNALSALAVATRLTGGPPDKFKGSLYPYQLDGFRWLSFMVHGGLGCIIADEMGLGKTVQIICLMLEIVGEGRGPCLVVSPATLLPNWEREIVRFAPSLRTLVHRGSQRTGFPAELRNHDVIISSYETVVTDISLFRNINWPIVAVDEAQGIKNPASKRAMQLKTLHRDCALAISGTPVENRLTDLWSITDFVMPSLLGTLAEYEKRHPDTLAGAAVLEPLVSPLILRRTVDQVAKDLPERIYMPQPLEMDEVSVAAYEMIRSEAETRGVGAGLVSLTKLRMFCTHPWLADISRSVEAAQCSVKLQRLFEIIDEIVGNNGKALIFTSYQESIDMLVAEIKGMFGIPADAIDGRVVPVTKRQEMVDVFTRERSSAVLVLNPKAAGTGLNITAANHVIHFNPEWNPAVEDQASARAYRRGQTQAVTIHQLYYANTVEEVMIERMQRKRGLASAAIAGTDGRCAEMDDLLQALRVSPARMGKGGE